MHPISFVKNAKRVLFVAVFSTLAFLSQAQLKVGDNPTNIQKSSILELESTGRVCFCRG
jgi:hypothetical protein